LFSTWLGFVTKISAGKILLPRAAPRADTTIPVPALVPALVPASPLPPATQKIFVIFPHLILKEQQYVTTVQISEVP